MKKKIEDIIIKIAEFGMFRAISIFGMALIWSWDLLTLGFGDFWHWDIGPVADIGLFICWLLLAIDWYVDRRLGL